jgi:hypothetical protein
VLEPVGEFYFAVPAPPDKVPAAVTKINEVKLLDAELRKQFPDPRIEPLSLSFVGHVARHRGYWRAGVRAALIEISRDVHGCALITAPAG